MTDNAQELDEILNQLVSKTADASYGEWEVVGLPEAKQAILNWHNKQIAKARISENEMYLQEADRHYFPAGPNDPYIPLVQFHERIGELTLKEHKEAEL